MNERGKDRANVWIIDDDEALATGVAVRFQAEGFEVVTANAGIDGYWMALKEKPQAIILDFKMPQAWGNTVLGKLKNNPETKDIPVVILSGMTDVGVQRDVLRLGAEQWVNKPFEHAELMRIVKKSMGEE